MTISAIAFKGALLTGIAVVLAACQSSSSSTSNFASGSGGKQVKICSGFGCIYQQTLAYSAKDIQYIRSEMKRGQKTAASERASMAKLIGWNERLAQKKLKMRRDTRLSYQVDAGIRGQMDCVDESNNTLAFIKFLNNEGLLRFHTPKNIGARGFLFDGRYPHKTATVTDPKGIVWALDSWKKDGGKPPQVIEYSKWKLERSSEYRNES